MLWGLLVHTVSLGGTRGAPTLSPEIVQTCEVNLASIRATIAPPSRQASLQPQPSQLSARPLG